MIQTTRIRNMSRFSTLPMDICEWLAKRMDAKRYPKHRHLFEEAQLCEYLYLIETGEVKLFKYLENGREIIIDFYHAGDAVGEDTLLDGGRFDASAQAHDNTDILLLRRDDYLELMQKFPAAAQTIIRGLNHRNQVLCQRIESLAAGNVEYRIAQVLLLLSRQIGKATDDWVELPLYLSRQELASMVGARMETVIRIMSRWQKQGLVKSHAQGFTLRQPKTLQVLEAVS